MSRLNDSASCSDTQRMTSDRVRAGCKGCLLLFSGGSAVALALLAHSCFIAGPHLSASRGAEVVHIQGRFLGEYSLRFERTRVALAGSDEPVCEFFGTTRADIDLQPGLNTPKTMFGPTARVAAAPGTPGACHIVPGETYRVTAWGNNGWGRVRPSSILVQF
jgi:hypothetical protein